MTKSTFEERMEQAAKVHKIALAMSEAALKSCDTNKVMELSDKISHAMDGVSHADLLLAMALLIIYQAHGLVEEKGMSLKMAIPAICTTIGILAQSAETTELPTNPMDIH